MYDRPFPDAKRKRSGDMGRFLDHIDSRVCYATFGVDHNLPSDPFPCGRVNVH